jgi:steroid 5-alpha reductase family enzyme
MLRRRATKLASPLMTWQRSRAVTSSPGGSTVPSPLATSAKIFGAANLLGLGVSLATGSHYHLDLLGTGAFTLAAIATAGSDPRQLVSAAAVGIWSAKLAAFLVYRVFHTTHDARLDDTLASASGAVGFWTISCLWGWLVSLPHTIAAATPGPRPSFGRATDRAGLLLLVLGLAVESLADWQKWRFKQSEANRGRFCDEGLWQTSQHPNWCGNLMFWTGILVLNTQTLLSDLGPVRRRPAAAFLVAACSPLFMLALFYGQASGAMTNTVELAERRYGADPAFGEYVSSTPLMPTPQSLARLLG